MSHIARISVDNMIDRYEVLLFDSFGVLAGSTGTLEGAVELVDYLNQINKTYFILTNDASALPSTRSQKYKEFGLRVEPSQIITSGSLLVDYFSENNLIGSRCVVLGPPDSGSYVEAAGGKVMNYNEDFEVIVIADQAGFPFVKTVDTVMSKLFEKLDAGQEVPLIMPNPDLIYPEGSGFGMASASVGIIFEAALGLRYPTREELKFVRLGKPNKAIYQEAFRRSGTLNMAMIGDQLETDILGANQFGIDSILVDTGISKSGASISEPNLRPTYLLDSIFPSDN